MEPDDGVLGRADTMSIENSYKSAMTTTMMVIEPDQNDKRQNAKGTNRIARVVERKGAVAAEPACDGQEYLAEVFFS